MEIYWIDGLFKFSMFGNLNLNIFVNSNKEPIQIGLDLIKNLG